MSTAHVDQSQLRLTHRNPENEADPIAYDDQGQWWFWDETWSYAHGPYDDEAQAVQALAYYADTL